MTANANITYGFEHNSDDDGNQILLIIAGDASWVLLTSQALSPPSHVHLCAQLQRENTRTTPISQIKKVGPRKVR